MAPSRVATAATLVISFVLSPAVYASDRRDAPVAEVAVDVPFLPQTEALCGGAAAAMLMRYWGQAHASVREFEPLVDRKAGGISEAVLSAALVERGWTAVRLAGSLETLRSELMAHRPPIILIEDRPRRYHYVVVVGIGGAEVLVHDPTWGPARRVMLADLQRAWQATEFWMLRLTPGPGFPRDARLETRAVAASPHSKTASQCDVAMDSALDEIAARGFDRADDTLRSVAARCPADPRPWGELAAVRFSQKRWSEAADLARQALSRDHTNTYASDVLASSLFMMDDTDGALRAWNIAGHPQLDSVRISGLTRTRYALLTEALGLDVDTTLSAGDFLLARRRLASMPDLSSARLSLRPGDDGFAVVDVAVVERPALPRQPIQWTATAVRTAIDRELTVRMPGPTGQGEAWTAAWRWWENRPAASLRFAAPRTNAPRGVWQAGLSWEAQAYGPAASPVREERVRGEVGLASWVTPNLQLSAIAGLDRWSLVNGEAARTVSLGGEVERRLFADRISARLAATRWIRAGSSGFSTFGASLSFANRVDPSPLVLLAAAGVSSATAGSPLALWSGAGEGRARSPLLRAHPLLDDGRISGPMFGRQLMHGTGEVQHWFNRPAIVRLGAAAFVDGASVSQRLSETSRRAFQLDAGAGLRVRLPASSSTLRIDYARGLRDGTHAWTMSWQTN